MTENDWNSRIKSLEIWRIEVDRDRAVHTEQRKHMDERFDRIESDMKDGFKNVNDNYKTLMGAIWKLALVLGVPLVISIVGFAVTGGFIK